MSSLRTIKAKVLPRLVENGNFGTDKVRFIEYKDDDSVDIGPSYQSSVNFGDVIMETKNGDKFTQSVMIKTFPERLSESVAWSLERNPHLQFQNEFLFYSEILPLLSKCDHTGVVEKIFPKFFYGSIVPGGSPIDNILILENVQKLGFKHTKSKTFVDYEHIKLTLEWLGKFHALSQMCQKKFPKEFEELCAKIHETLWTKPRVTEHWDTFFIEQGKRGILPLQNDPKYKHRLEGIIEVIEEADLSMAKLVTPQEPTAVICHGDVCCCNIFYGYDSDGKPSDIIFFDFGTVRYASPVIDLSFFLFMSSSPEVRTEHWTDMLDTYHAALTANLHVDSRDIPSAMDVEEEFKRRGLYGYVHASYYLPVLLKHDWKEEKDKVRWWTLNVEDIIKVRLATGGERATQIVVEIVKHMIDKQFDFGFIKSIDYKP